VPLGDAHELEEHNHSLADGSNPGRGRAVSRLGALRHADDSAEDFEVRQKPPFITIPGTDALHDVMTEQQRKGVRAIFQDSLDDFGDCAMIHQYAEPLQVIDSMEEGAHKVWGRLHKGKVIRYKLAKREPEAAAEEEEDEKDDDEKDDDKETSGDDQEDEQDDGDDKEEGDEKEEEEEGEKKEGGLPILVRPGAVYDSSTGHAGKDVHVDTSMFANLQGLSNPVQVIPHGHVARWSSKWKVPMAGFLCQGKNSSDSAPVFYTLPTPCVNTVMDQEGNQLDPILDEYQVWIGNTRVAFKSKAYAEDFCTRFAKQIAEDLSTLSWDAEHLSGVLAEHRANGGTGYTVVSTESTQSNEPAPLGLGGPAVAAPAPAAALAVAPAPDPAVSLLEKSRHHSRLRSLRLRRQRLRRRRHSHEHEHKDEDDEEDAQLRRRLRRERAEMAAGEHSHRFVEDVALAGLPESEVLQNPNLMSFCLAAGKKQSPEGWTKGTKRLLVVVMDWKDGDTTLSPFSHQMKNPEPIAHYKQKIVPQVSEKFSAMSYGQYGLTVDIVPKVVKYLRNRNAMTGKLPFPALYEEARAALQHGEFNEKYTFKAYDLVFVIHPQVQPMGTKGVAWVGSRGAVCNGCEMLSDNFKIMVMVHELGHNLGLSHASSVALEYGNPFDWMGNYPEVVGLHYGLGYKRELGWITDDNIMTISDSLVGQLNDMVFLKPYDQQQGPQGGDVVGIRISLSGNAEDIYLSYRASARDVYRGLYVVKQSKESPHSNLVDAACHSLSQRDAHLRAGWTWMDPTQQVVVKVVEQTDGHIKVHLFHVQKGQGGGIRARPQFTDGWTKCPVTCQDADLLISQTCAELEQGGYCRGGSLHMNGKKLNIATQICPQSCGMCSGILSNTPTEVTQSRCVDQNVQISGLGCPDIAARDMCQMKTTSGHILGRDLCPVSCKQCPRVPSADNANVMPDPTPVRTVGQGGGGGSSFIYVSSSSDPTVCPGACEESECRDGDPNSGGVALAAGAGARMCSAHCSKTYGGMRYCGFGELYETPGSVDCSACVPPEELGVGPAAEDMPEVLGDAGHHEGAGDVGLHEGADDAGHHEEEGDDDSDDDSDDDTGLLVCEDDVWFVDQEGHDCTSYANTIKVWGRNKTCFQNLEGAGAIHCRKTCDTCDMKSHEEVHGCSDNTCIGPWKIAFGRCFQCSDYPLGCYDPKYKEVFEAECPLTCGLCHPDAPKIPGGVDPMIGDDGKEVKEAEYDPNCTDSDKKLCTTLGFDYCSEEQFASQCKRTCELCPPKVTHGGECIDRFSSYTCARYERWGWCDRGDTKDTVRLQCPVTCGVCDGYTKDQMEAEQVLEVEEEEKNNGHTPPPRAPTKAPEPEQGKKPFWSVDPEEAPSDDDDEEESTTRKPKKSDAAVAQPGTALLAVALCAAAALGWA